MTKFALSCFLFLASVSLASADLKVAVVDLGRAFDQYYKTKEASARINDKQEAFKKEDDEMVADYQKLVQEGAKIENAANDPTLSPDAQKESMSQLAAKKQDVNTLQQKIVEIRKQRNREIQDELVRRHKEIVDEITKVVNDYTLTQGFDLVLDRSTASGASGSPIILYTSNKLPDITADVITKLNAGAPAAGTAGAAPASTMAPATVAH